MLNAPLEAKENIKDLALAMLLALKVMV